VVAAGVRNDATTPFIIRPRRDLVVGAAEFECADRLEVLQFQEKAAPVASVCKMRFENRRVDRDATQTALSLLDVLKSNDGDTPEKLGAPTG
jgi:hypothetical protein